MSILHVEGTFLSSPVLHRIGAQADHSTVKTVSKRKWTCTVCLEKCTDSLLVGWLVGCGLTQIAWLCWANVGIRLYGWPMVGVGSTTLAQHCPYVNILSLAVGSISSWNQYVGPTLGQCTPVTCFHRTRLRWEHYVGPTLDQRMPATLFWITVCWKYYVGPTLSQCTPVTWFNITRLRWVHYVGPTLDQRMPATLVLDNSLLKILRWPNVGPMYTGDAF